MMPIGKGWKKMSGHKRATVTISEQEYRRLHEADMQKRFRKKKEVDTPEREQEIQAMRTAFDELQDRQSYYETLIAHLDDEILRIEEDTSRELMAYQEAFNQELNDQMDFASNESSAILDSLTERFQEELQRERRKLAQRLQRFDRQMEQWHQDVRHQHQTAHQWLEQSMAIYDFIHNQFETERFTPGRMERIHRRLSLAQANLDQGMPEASLQAAQQAFMELSDLRIELETRTMEWQNQFQNTYAAGRDLHKTILANAHVAALDVAGQELPFLIDLEYWSSGAYDALLRESKHICQYLREHQQSLRLEDLQRIRNQELPRLQTKLESMIYEARLEAIQSQLRINIADLALQALEHQGYSLQQAGFAEDDLRGSFVATLRNEDRSSISLRIQPKQGQDLTSDLIVVSNDSAMRTAGELFARFQAIRSSLGQKGLTIRQVQSNASPPQVGSGRRDFVVQDRDRETQKITFHVRSHKI
jgi:hypothetical protein